MQKKTPFEELALMAKQRADEVFELVFDKLAPQFDQKDIDRLYSTLRVPLQDVQKDFERFVDKYPLLKKLGADKVGWIVMQGADTLHLAASLFNDRQVSSKSKAKLACAIAYFISPIDIIPEGLLGPIGYVDDVLLVVWVIDSILNGQNEQEKELVQRLWQGTPEDLETLRGLLKHFDVVKALRLSLTSKVGR